MTQFYVQGREEAVYDGAGDDYAFARCSQRLLASHNKETVSGSGNKVQVTLDVFGVDQLLRRAGSLFKVRMNTP